MREICCIPLPEEFEDSELFSSENEIESERNENEAPGK